MPDPHGAPPEHPTDRLVGQASAIQTLRTQIRQLAAFDAVGRASVPAVLLSGETGTGKGLVARVLHDSGPRAHGPFIDVNCAAIPETMLEAEVFGYEAGAFTDAKRAKPGLFEAASGGTLFLDEIDALPVMLQSKLLKVIEEKRLRRLGAVADHAVDVKLIAATAADLRARVAAGQFRLDLYHRLAVVLLELPPLRTRGEDIMGLARQFLQRYAAGHRVSLKRLSSTAEAWLLHQAWPGNVRELSHLMERVTLLHPEEVIEAAALAQFGLPSPPGENAAVIQQPPTLAAPPDESTRIRQALIRTGGNVVRAAQLLGLRRDALRYRMRRQGIRPPTLAELSTCPPSVPSSTHGPRAEVPPDGPGGFTPTVRPEVALAWEPKLVAIMALELTWPAAEVLESPAYDPWTVAARWEQALVAKVRGFGGVVLQHTPSLLLIAFGIPRTLDQQPQRAVHAALALRHGAVGDQARLEEGPAPTLRLGLHWGTLLVVAPIHEQTPPVRAIGETLAVPVRLLGQAAPGEVLASGAMARLIDGWCALEPRRGWNHLGNEDGIGVSVIIEARSELSAPAGLAPRRLRPLVGRAQQMATLRELWRGAQGGRGQVVGLIGEPGVGKSRLVAEFLRGSFASGARLLETSATAYTQTTPYGPIRHLLRRVIGIADADDGSTVREQVTQYLARLDLPSEPTLAPLLSLCHGPLDDPPWSSLDPSMRRQRTLEAIQQVLRRESQVQPVLVVCEDAHWLDHETQAVLDRLVDGITEVPLLLLVTGRPEYRPPWGHRADSTLLPLDPLSPMDTGVLLDHWLGPDASLNALRHHLIARTGGNPFFLEESVQTLLETQALVGEPGAYSLAQGLPTFTVPATVQTVLAARIDRLSPELKRVLQTAAVIGQEVPLAWLQAVADLSATGLRRTLAELQEAQFLDEKRHFPEPVYTFRHALTQQVAYETLLQERRRALHARLVETFEARAPERRAELLDRLAYHGVRGEVWDKALVYSRQAGEHAMARSAYREAVGSFEQALRALTHRPETHDTREQAVDLRLLLRSALRPQGDFSRILALLGEAEVHARALDDPHRLGQVSMWLSNYFSLVGVYDQAVAAAQRALALADASGDVVLRALTNRYLGQAYEDQGDYRRAIDCLVETIVSLDGALRYERFGQPYVPAVIACAHLAECHAEIGRFAEGRAFGEEGLRIAEAMAHPTSLMYVVGEMGQLFLRQGDLANALPLLERAVHLCHEADLSAHTPWNISALGVALALSGRVDAAVPLLTQAMEQASSMDVVVLQARCRLALGQAQVLAGCLKEAQALAEQTLTLARDHRLRGVQAYALYLLGEITGRSDPVDVAQTVTFYRQALVLAEDLGMRPLQAHCHRGLGTFGLGMEQRAEARTELTAAMALYRAMDMTLWMPEVNSSLAALEASPKASG